MSCGAAPEFTSRTGTFRKDGRVRILVALHTLALGGGITAIDLAAGAAAEGHEVMIYGVPGPLTDTIEKKGLRFVPARPLRYRPAPSRIGQLFRLARRERLDLIHAYEWPPCLDAYFGATFLNGTPLVCTVYSMEVPPYVPRSVPLIMGTRALRDEAAAAGYRYPWLLEPPIDLSRDDPALVTQDFRADLEIPADAPLVVCTSRLALNAKLESLVEAMDAVDVVATDIPVRFVIIGDGDAAEVLRARGEAINRRHGRTVITLPGAVADTRGAYRAADVVVGMGSSILRGLAFGRPVIVQGEQGFAQTFTRETSEMFLRQGMWGLGPGTPVVASFAAQLRALLSSPDRRRELGTFGRQIVEEHFSLTGAVRRQLDLYEQTLALPPRRHPVEAAQVGGLALQLEWRLHDPRRKRARAEAARRRYDEARAIAALPAEDEAPRVAPDR